MKKAVKAIIAASAVAAVVGVGAVSFAKWEGTSNTSVTTEASTGSINYISIKQKPETTIYLTDLLPYDQNGTTVVQTTDAHTLGKAVFSVEFGGYTSYTLRIGALPGQGFGGGNGITFTDGTAEEHTTLYASTSYDGTSVITGTEDWTEVSIVDPSALRDPSAIPGFSGLKNKEITVYFILDSNQTDQMNKSFGVFVQIEGQE